MRVFADLKNDFVFRRIFATHPELLRGLLNDLLEKTGDETIEGIEYLPSEQLPIVEGAKYSILDVRCRDRAGTTFVVEMQLLHSPGFVNRVVYNACKAYVGQLRSGEGYAKLSDVVAISICNFELWPDSEQKAKGLPLVPMLSRWNMVERSSKNNGLLQVQYAFMELPKGSRSRPMGPGAMLWAWLFSHAPELPAMPTDLSPGPYREALELAALSKLSWEELDAYERVAEEIRQVDETIAAREAKGRAEGRAEGLAEGRAEGRAEGLAQGLAEGERKGKLAAIFAVLAARGIEVSQETKARIEACEDMERLGKWVAMAASVASGEDLG